MNKYSQDMSLNSSSSNDSLLHPYNSFNNSDIPYEFILLKTGLLNFSAYCITKILLLLPLSILVLYVGLQRQRQQHSNSSTAMSHSDVFTYHLVTMELFGVLGCIICCCGVYRKNFKILLVGFGLWSFVWYGEMYFHILTCVERYLAVVHPITYLSLRGERGIRIRNMNIGCAWVLSFGGTSLITVEDASAMFNVCLLIFSFIVIFFCSISVLFVLIRPKPGEQGKVDQSKLRAFYTITVILGVLLVRLVWNLIWAGLSLSSDMAVLNFHGSWFNLPCSLVLPLLFLHRAGIFACRRANTKRG